MSTTTDREDEILSIIKTLGGASAYDVMRFEEEADPGRDADVAYARNQSVSGTCSKLHAENRLHKTGRVENPSSGHLVNFYVVNTDENAPCQCGACPGVEDVYKGLYEEQVVARSQERTALTGRIRDLEGTIATLQAQIEFLQYQVDKQTSGTRDLVRGSIIVIDGNEFESTYEAREYLITRGYSVLKANEYLRGLGAL